MKITQNAKELKLNGQSIVFCLRLVQRMLMINVNDIKDTKLYVLVVTLSARDNQKLSKLLSIGFDWSEYKTKNENKNTTNKFRYFLKSKLKSTDYFSLVYLNRDNDVKQFKTRRYYLPEVIIKNYNVIINGKIDSDIK